MTVSTINNRIVYNGDGVSTIFAFNIYFLANTDLIIYVDDVLQVLNVDYTVTGAGLQSGGSVEFTIAPPVGVSNVIAIRDVDLLQSTDLPSNGPFPAETVERMSDKLTMTVQRLKELIGRSLILSDADVSGVSTVLPSPSGGQVVGWKADETGLQNYDYDALSEAAAESAEEAAESAAIAVAASASALTFKSLKGVGGLDTSTLVTVGMTVSALGFNAAGDGGSNDYLIVAAGSGTESEGYFDLAVHQAQGLFPNGRNVKQWGCVGDGATDDTTAITNAKLASLGYKLFFPKGTYLTDAVSAASMTGVNFVGEDKHSTILKLNASQNTHLVSYSDSVNCSIINMTIDQNTTNQTGGHGMRLGGVDGLLLQNIIIKECNDYGIGVQAGTNKNVTIDNFEINGAGIDGIDIKDYELDNENITLSNGVIKDFGREGTTSGGLDIRGPVVVDNLHIVAQNANNRGFRLRIESVQGRAGSGVLDNIEVLISDSTAQGMVTEGATVNNFTISNVTVRGGVLGAIGSTGGLLKNLSSYGATTGEALSISGVDNSIDGLVIDGASRSIDVEAAATGNTVSNFNLKNITGTDAVRIQATADNNSFINGVVQSGKGISDSATNTTISRVRNWKTTANLISSDILVDSTGTKAVNITHGLAVTPNLEDITLTVIRSTGSPTDYRIGMLHIDGVSSTVVAVRAVVTTASATSGAAIKLALTVRAKNS